MKSPETASITVTPAVQEWASVRKSCGHGDVVRTVPDTRRGMPPGSTRSESVPCNCGG